tara:strand:+ start:362 stop:484 length:123 start_codon:yes stop_codon:yes gene_type:complete
MKSDIPQKQKNAKGTKTAYIWEVLDSRYGLLDANDSGVIA